MRWMPRRLALLLAVIGLMFYATLETAAPVLANNFTADLTAIAGAKAVPVLPAPGGINTGVTLYKRLPAELFAAIEQNPLPGVGLYAERLGTQAKAQGQIRDNLVSLVGDYYARGTDAVVLMTQLELASEALLRFVDRLWSAGGGIYGAGEADRSVDVVLLGVGPVGQDTYEGRVLVRFPVNTEDTGV